LHFFLQIIKFEEIRKNYSYIIVYNDLYEQFFFIFSNLIIYKRNNAKIKLTTKTSQIGVYYL